MMTVDIHPNAPPPIVALVVGRRVAEQVLVRQLVEQFAERAVQLVDAVGEQRAAAGRRGEALHDAFERVHRDAASLADHVERHVARLQPPLDVAMLPLMSMPTMSSSGMSSDAKWEIFCGCPSSKT